MILRASLRILLASFSDIHPLGLSPFCQPASSLRFRLWFAEISLLPNSKIFSCLIDPDEGLGASPASISNASKSGPNGN